MSRKSKGQSVDDIVARFQKLDIDEQAKCFVQIKDAIVKRIEDEKLQLQAKGQYFDNLKDNLGS